MIGQECRCIDCIKAAEQWVLNIKNKCEKKQLPQEKDKLEELK